MRRLQVILLLILFLAPILILLGAGGYALFRSGWFFYLWWVLPVCWGGAFVLQRRWKLFVIPMPGMKIDPPLHWTPRDKEAAALIEARQKRVGEVPGDRLAEPQFYVDTAREVSFEIARVYHPRAADPWTSVTITEVLAAAQLALADVEDWANRYLPGSQLVSLRTWQSMARANRWIDAAYYTYWLGSVLINPLNLSRYFASKVAIEPLSDKLQANVLGLFYVFFVRQVGFYAIEMNSGRLRGGVARYRDAMARADAGRDALIPLGDAAPADPATAAQAERTQKNGAPAKPGGPPPSEPLVVTIAVVGQVKAGKSSLVNTLLGERRAGSDVLPLTQKATEYRLTLAGSNERLVIVDTAGYGADAPGEASWKDSGDAVRRADLVLLVMKSTSPARSADLSFLTAMQAWYRAHPDRKPPHVLGVLTHIDGLSPALEWSPPYQWETPTTAKEEHIREAVDYAHETLAPHLAAVVPVCSDVARSRVYGVAEWLVPAVSELLGEARGAALVRNLHAELDADRFRQVLGQIRNIGSELLRMVRK